MNARPQQHVRPRHPDPEKAPDAPLPEDVGPDDVGAPRLAPDAALVIDFDPAAAGRDAAEVDPIPPVGATAGAGARGLELASFDASVAFETAAGPPVSAGGSVYDDDLVDDLDADLGGIIDGLATQDVLDVTELRFPEPAAGERMVGAAGGDLSSAAGGFTPSVEGDDVPGDQAAAGFGFDGGNGSFDGSGDPGPGASDQLSGDGAAPTRGPGPGDDPGSGADDPDAEGSEGGHHFRGDHDRDAAAEGAEGGNRRHGRGDDDSVSEGGSARRHGNDGRDRDEEGGDAEGAEGGEGRHDRDAGDNHASGRGGHDDDHDAECAGSRHDDDMLRLSGHDFSPIDLGDGDDTVQIALKGMSFGSDDADKLANVETLSLTGFGANAVTLSPDDVLAMSDGDEPLFITGNANDSVTLTGDGPGGEAWAAAAGPDPGTTAYVWSGNAAIQVVIDNTVQQSAETA